VAVHDNESVAKLYGRRNFHASEYAIRRGRDKRQRAMIGLPEPPG
jgi:hypothetical protein